MNEKMTIEQALTNLQSVCDNFVGKRADHIALEISMKTIREALAEPKPLETIKP